MPLPLDGLLDLHAFDPAELGDLLPTWIDESHAAGLRALRVVHGKGTGALMKGVRSYLDGHPLVASFRTGERFEGGDGVTVVTMR